MRTNNEIITLIQNCVNEKSISMSELARRVGIAKSTMSRYFNRTREFPLNRADDFAKALGITPEYLLGINKENNTNSSEIATIYNKLHEPRQTKVLMFAKNQLDDQENETNSYTYNYFDSAISAGTGQYLSDVRVEEIELPVDYDADFVVPIYGDSMEPEYHNQDYVFIKLSVDLSDASIGVFDLNGDAYIKELRITNKGSYLHSLNPNYRDIQITEDDNFRVIGTVVGRYNENYNK